MFVFFLPLCRWGKVFAWQFQSKVGLCTETFKICYNYQLTQSKCKMSPLSGVGNVCQTGQENGGVISTNSMDKSPNKETVHRQLGIHDSKYNSSIQWTAKKWHDQSRASAHLICPTTHEEGHHNRWKGRKHDNAQLNIRSRRLYLVCKTEYYMGLQRYGISLWVFNSNYIKLSTKREIPYHQATMCHFVYYINILLTTRSQPNSRFNVPLLKP